MLKDFFAYYNAPLQSTVDTATPGTWNNHWRSSHIAEEAKGVHTELGWTEPEFKDLQLVTSDLNSPNPSLELRVRGYNTYVYQQFESTTRMHFGYIEKETPHGRCLYPTNELSDPAELAANLTRQWDATSHSFGRLSQLMKYRRGLGLPDLDHL